MDTCPVYRIELFACLKNCWRILFKPVRLTKVYQIGNN